MERLKTYSSADRFYSEHSQAGGNRNVHQVNGKCILARIGEGPADEAACCPDGGPIVEVFGTTGPFIGPYSMQNVKRFARPTECRLQPCTAPHPGRPGRGGVG